MLQDKSGIKKIKPFLRLLLQYKYIILLIYFLAVIIYILSPVFHKGCICNTDFVSNLMRAVFMNHNLTHYLSLDRWTYMQYMGFQPFLFYFPGFFILINLIHIISFGLISLMASYKLLILASFLFLPISVYFCMRTFKFKKIHAFFAAFFSLSSGLVYGYGFKNLTVWGMDVNFFVISLLPALLAMYHKFIKSDKLNIYTLFFISFLFTTIAVSHLQTTLHFLLVLLFYNIYVFYQIKDKVLYLKKNLFILVVTCLLVGFWYFPVLKFYEFFGVLTTCEVDTLVNRTINFLRGDYLTIQPVAILFIFGLLLIKSKIRKNRLLGFFPFTALIIFVMAAEYYAQNVENEFIRYLFNMFTTRSYAIFCLLLSFIAGFALGEIIILIRKGSYLCTSFLRKKLNKKRIIHILNNSLTWLSRIIILLLCAFFITASFRYMFSFKGYIFTESDTSLNYKPKLLMDTFNWLKENAGKYDLIGQQYQIDPISDMSGAGYLVCLQYHTGLPIFGGGHFESSQVALTMTFYDNEDYFKKNDADYLHKNLMKFNMKYLVIDNRQEYLDKLLQYTTGFEQVHTNSLLSILKITGSNSMFLSDPVQYGIKVLNFVSNLENYNPKLSWKIDNTHPGTMMTLSLAYFPKWKVYIDGREIEAQKNNDFMLTIPLEKKGIQTVTIEYKATFFEIVFAVLSLVTLFFIIVMFIRLVIIKRKDISLFKRNFWVSRFTKNALTHKIFLFTVIAAGSIVIFLFLGALFKEPQTGPPIIDESEESVYVNTVWKFSYMTGNDKILISENLMLLPDRKISGILSKNEDHWAVENGFLVFYTKDNVPSTRFTRVTKTDDKFILEGDFLLSDHVIHVLEQLDTLR